MIWPGWRYLISVGANAALVRAQAVAIAASAVIVGRFAVRIGDRRGGCVLLRIVLRTMLPINRFGF